MKKLYCPGLVLVAFLFLRGAVIGADNSLLPGAAAAYGEHGMVASVHPLATEAGVKVLRAGGNAVDAAVAVALTLGVVDGHNSGIGGGCFMLIRLANGSLMALDGREMAPAAATRDMYLREGKAVTTLSQTGALASGVPGSLAAYNYAVNHFGRKKLEDLLLPAAEIAERGFILDSRYAGLLLTEENNLAQFPASKAVYFKTDGHPYAEGDLFKQPDLAGTYRHIAQLGVGWFYAGPFARAVESWMRENGGLLTAQDFRGYHLAFREPVTTTYRGFKIVSFPPPSSGGVHVIEMLNILENFNLKALDEATRLHVIAESMKLAFADRAFWLGDPDFADVPVGLVDKAYAASLAKRIDLKHTVKVAEHGIPPGAEERFFRKHTTHFSVADAAGNWVACTATVNTSFGSKVVIPGTGVVLNNQMDDFSIQTGVANAFGLVGADANAVGPGKRPLSSMSPTIVLKNDQPILALGAAGGPTIISQVLQELVDMLDLGLPPEVAIAQPRIHHQWSPDSLVVESRMSPKMQTALEGLGHKLEIRRNVGVSQIVGRTKDGKSFVGVADPRVAIGRAGGE